MLQNKLAMFTKMTEQFNRNYFFGATELIISKSFKKLEVTRAKIQNSNSIHFSGFAGSLYYR